MAAFFNSDVRNDINNDINSEMRNYNGAGELFRVLVRSVSLSSRPAEAGRRIAVEIQTTTIQ